MLSRIEPEKQTKDMVFAQPGQTLISESSELKKHKKLRLFAFAFGSRAIFSSLIFSLFQTEIAKRLNAIIAQILPFLSQEHQAQVAQAVDRAKQVTMPELNAIIGVSFFLFAFFSSRDVNIAGAGVYYPVMLTFRPGQRQLFSLTQQRS